jgi:hypothetical protein
VTKLSGSIGSQNNSVNLHVCGWRGEVGGAFVERRKGGRAFPGFTSEAADLWWKRLAGGCVPTALGPFAKGWVTGNG